jgi:uncharacterized membrane protein
MSDQNQPPTGNSSPSSSTAADGAHSYPSFGFPMGNLPTQAPSFGIPNGQAPNAAFPQTHGVVQIGISQSQAWQSPFPPPDAVEKYEAASPGFLSRVIVMAETLQAAQIEQSNRMLSLQWSAVRRGQVLGFIGLVIGLAGAAYCAAISQPWLGAVFLAVPVMGVATALIHSAFPRSQASTAANPPSTGGSQDAPARR